MEYYKEHLIYEGVTMEIEVDYETHVLLKNELNRQQYAQQVYDQVFNKPENELVPVVPSCSMGRSVASCSMQQSIATCSMQPSIAGCSMRPVVASGTIQQELHVNDDTTHIQEQKACPKWDDKLIRCLLAVRLEKEAEFTKPHCKKIKLWKDVAAKVNEISGENITAEACDTKYRNLLATYRKNKLKQCSTGEGHITWEYFEDMDKVLGNKASSCPPKETLLDSLSQSDVENKEGVVTDEDEPQKKIKKLKRVTKKEEISLQMYLFEKNKREKLKEEEARDREERKERRKTEQWLEQKALKEKEIDAILTLAKTIAEKR